MTSEELRKLHDLYKTNICAVTGHFFYKDGVCFRKFIEIFDISRVFRYVAKLFLVVKILVVHFVDYATFLFSNGGPLGLKKS